ncbi:MAG TPA: hypothetical protein VHN78_15180 [Chloroflexota bacterium]|nr:hypothetical protein [Chloroflexota bacterium]
MNLMLYVIFICVTFGLLVRHFSGRQTVAIAVLATVMTAIYFFSGQAM